MGYKHIELKMQYTLVVNTYQSQELKFAKMERDYFVGLNFAIGQETTLKGTKLLATDFSYSWTPLKRN